MENYFDLSGGEWVNLVLFVLLVGAIIYLNYKDEKSFQSQKKPRKNRVHRVDITECPVSLGQQKDQREYFYIADDPTIIKGETIIHLN